MFDTHAHLNSQDFADNVDEVVTRAREAGLVGIAVIGIDLATSLRAVELATHYPGFLHAVVGIQPNSLNDTSEGDFQAITKLAQSPTVRAIGETGLDRYWKDVPMSKQHESFDQHLELSRQSGLPFVIHMRDCGADVVDQLKRQPGKLPAGVMHSFVGDWALASDCLALGLMISFAGMVTFKNNQALRDVAARVPEDRLLIETDSPYLSPEPLRGRRPNEPARVRHTLECLAVARNVSVQHLRKVTTRNAERFFQLNR